jgi:tetratricopeptide (TPR) repeat protein
VLSWFALIGLATLVTMLNSLAHAQEIPAPAAAVLVPGVAPTADDPSSAAVSIRRAAMAESATDAADGKPLTAPTLVLHAPAPPTKQINALSRRALPPSSGTQKQLGLVPVDPPQKPLLTAAVGDNQLQPTTVPPPAPPAGVPPNDAAALRAAYNDAFKAMAADPGNLDKTFRFAELASQIGDLEGAVSALERMLLLNPNLPRVRLELGVLYYRLGSQAAARAYIVRALESPDLPPPVRERAEKVLAMIDKAAAPSKLSGLAMVGLRYQSNANAAPGGDIKIGGIDAHLDQTSTATKDFNAFALSTLRHLYDLGTQYGDMLDTQLVVYGARQFKRSDVNLAYASLTSGPRTWIYDDTWARPYVGLDYVLLDKRTEYFSPTGGMTVEHNFKGGDDVMGLLGVAGEWQLRRYHNSQVKPFNSDRTGNSWTARGYADVPISRWLTVSGGGGYTWYYARAGYQSYREVQLYGGATASFPGAFGPPERNWTFSTFATRVWTNYAEPDITVDPNTAHRDREWRLAATLTAPFADEWALIGQAARNSRSSTVSNYEFVNYIGLLGVAYRY